MEGGVAMNIQLLESIFKLPLLFSRFFQLFIGRVIGTLIAIFIILIFSTLLYYTVIDLIPLFIMQFISDGLVRLGSTLFTVYLTFGSFLAILPELSYKRKLYKKS